MLMLITVLPAEIEHSLGDKMLIPQYSLQVQAGTAV